MGYDWLYGYPGFTAAFKNQVATMLARWSDQAKVSVYRVDDPASNYAEGAYVSRVLTALALGGGRNTNGTRLINEALVYRQGNVLPVITNVTTSLYGGFWAEGWNYGQQASRNLILSGLALETAGLANISPERTWAGQVIHSWVETAGASKLFGQTFSRSSLLSSNAAVNCPDDPSGALVYRIATWNGTKATNVTYVTALQSAPSTNRQHGGHRVRSLD